MCTVAIGNTLGCPGDSAKELAAGTTPTAYGAVDDQLNSNHPWLTTGTGSQAKPVITYAAIIGSDTNPQQHDVVMTVVYAYHPLIPIPGLLSSTVQIAQIYQNDGENAAMDAAVPSDPQGSCISHNREAVRDERCHSHDHQGLSFRTPDVM